MRWIALVSVVMVACAQPDAEEVSAVPDGRPLRALAADHDLRFGTFLFSAGGPSGPDQEPFQSALHEHDLYILPVFFKFVQPERGTYDFALPDAVADAAPPTTALYVSGLIWNELLPEWLTTGNYSAAEQRAILVDFVTRVVDHFHTRYPGRVIAFEIVLEPLSWNGPGGFWNRIGLDAGLDQYEYIRVAYRTARATAPDATLYIDDFGVEEGPKADAYVELVSRLLGDGVPIDGVGFEGHFMIDDAGAFPEPPSTETLTANLDRFGDLGLETMITSVDVSILNAEVSDRTLDHQAHAYRHLLRACLAAASCKAFATWGLGDHDSWILDHFDGWGAPLLFDEHYVRKPAYDAVWTELALHE